jgi:hypothetical protein
MGTGVKRGKEKSERFTLFRHEIVVGRPTARAVSMRFAAIANVHGNRFALEAVRADIAANGISEVANLGDHVSGPLDAARTAEMLHCPSRSSAPRIGAWDSTRKIFDSGGTLTPGAPSTARSGGQRSARRPSSRPRPGRSRPLAEAGFCALIISPKLPR